MKKIKYKKYFFTKVNESFCKSFLTKLNVDTDNILYIRNNDTIMNTLNKNKIQIKNSILINNEDFKKINSLLLILINE